MIQVNHLSRHYGDFKAVDDVSFGIQQGEVIGLLGHNGAGKTTIMKMLTGFLEPTAGSITVDGLSIGKDTQAIQQRIGYLPENCPVWPEMTVLDYLRYQADLHGIPANAQRQAVTSAIRRTALQAKASAMIATLSRGYRQRVGVAQAILHNPAIIILDEPTNGLDPTQIHQMRELIRELASHATVILSTHILQEVQAVCERVLIMRSGKLVVDARLDELQQTRHLLLTLNSAQAATYLGKLEGVSHVETAPAGQGQYQYTLQASPELAPQVAAAVHAAGDQLHSLHTQTRTLETVFAEANNREAA
ncbi:ABC-2 type transport system ATP-binding protein [Thiothrix caldifontis]|uniref:ABC-2 type transport system ATP-binding protein n=1 Tax=Thiothrix caldifontis TaxID=525918 RepID=A0A1H4GMY4_9GAMM|nr:ATP-binding cassette domain-containing protein [Thiothrix caldifontis]SEB10002.1 ABC-2 type transport system ATP-binding protein [Thiothrix caldifontis]